MPAPSPCTNIRTTKTIKLRTAPNWLPEKFRKRTERIRLQFKPSAGERRLLRRKKMVPPSEWAPKNRVVTYGPLKGSYWDNAFMPHMRGIMDASFFPSVRVIGNCKAPQTGSSAGGETMVTYLADMRPGDTLVVYPDRDTGRKRFVDYLTPVFEKSPRLRRLMTGLADDTSGVRIKLKTMLIYLGWSGSDTTLGNVSALYLVGDEIDKWVRKSKTQTKGKANRKEASPLKLFMERFRAFTFGAKCWLWSTPTDVEGPIWEYMTGESQFIFDYHIPCPECGTMHRPSDKHIKFGDERDPKRVEEQDLARYVFPCCGTVGNDRVRIKALQDGKWFERLTDEQLESGMQPRVIDVCLKDDRPKKICFHSPAWISTRVSNSEIAAAFLRGLDDMAEMHYYDNQIKAVAHVPYRQNRKEDAILALRDDRPEGLVPGGGRVAALVAGVDTQDDGFYFTIRAFGWGMTQESWLIRHGEADTFEALYTILFDTVYTDPHGLYYPVMLAVIDSGGHRTGDVYDFARLNPGRVAAYKGASGRRANPKTKTIIDHYPGTKTPIPGGCELWICDSNFYKDILAKKLRIKTDLPGAYHLHSGTTQGFAQHYCAEYLDDRMLWQCPKNVPNHYWDCGVMEMVAVDLLGLKWQADPGGGQENSRAKEEAA